MKLLLICAGGMSTSMLIKKLEKYAAENGIENFVCEAHGVAEFPELYKDWDLTLYGPQISNRADSLRQTCGDDYPLGKIEPADYAIGNAPNIFKQVNKLLNK
ncbi:MAG: PTS sugar transporter subunit IIB [Anaerorhabdus sp.]|uniref:PTS sugar transporter subunit IIB n=1 Tax=Anaerorhabdus sp. TaxID=1872524 RepID=UPI003A88BAA3